MDKERNKEPRFAVIDIMDCIFWDSDDLSECLQVFDMWGEKFMRGVYDYEQGKYLDAVDVIDIIGVQIKTKDSSRGHHHLKIRPQYYMDVESGRKTFEIRFNDRGFKVGDILYLEEYCGRKCTGRMLMREVCYIIDDPEFCKEGFVVLGLKGV